jgi:hypothetical protein
MISAARPENQLLVCAAHQSRSGDAAGRLRSLLQRDLDWEYLLALADRHSLIPLLHYHLNSGCTVTVPPQVMSRLKDENQENIRSNLLLTGELIKLIDFLEAHDIKAIPFKGPTLALLAYGDVGLRQFGDLDILVRRQDVPSVWELLVSRGFRATPDLNRSHEAALLRFDCSHNFVSENGVYLDVHWNMVARYHGFRLDPNRLWDRLESIAIGGRPVRTLAPADLLIVLCLHGYTHFWERLGWICDLAGLIDRQKDMDWQRVLQNAAELGIQRIVSLGLFLAGELLEAPIPQEVWRVVQVDSAVRSLAEQVEQRLFEPETLPRGMFAGALLHLRMRERRRDKLKSCFYLVTTPRVDDWKLVSLPDWLFFLYYPLRPLRLAGKYGAKLLKGANPSVTHDELHS